MEGGNRDDLLRNLTLNDRDELLATKKISKYFPDSPVEEYIHVIVEPPVSATASDEVLELRKQLASMQELLNMTAHGMYKVLEMVERLRDWDASHQNFFKPIVALQSSTSSLVRNER
jgi:hypothetical protein